MLFTDEFITSLRDDPIAGAKEACRMAFEKIRPSAGWTEEEFQALLEAYILIAELVSSGLLPITLIEINLTDLNSIGDKSSEIKKQLDDVLAHCDQMVKQARIERLKSRFKNGLGVEFAYEFSQGDLNRVQVVINELRDLIGAAEGLEQDHQRRLLKRLEALQSEIHKRVSDLDRFWGLVGDAGVVHAKLGTDAKPIVDRIREIADIVWQTQGRAEELPSGAKPPQIGHDKTNSSDA